MTKYDLSGRTALVTGGAVRIGRAICQSLADAGAKVVINYNHSSEEADQLVDEIRGRGGQSWAMQADLGSQEQLLSLVPRARDLAGHLDILVNNASIFPVDDFSTFTLEDLHRNVEVNAWAPLALARSFGEMTDTGDIVNIIDGRMVGYDWGHVAYHSSKYLLGLFHRMMAIRMAPGIKVNAVGPGLILPPEGKDQAYIESLKEKVPLKRVGSPEAVADAVLFLLSSDYITGQVIFVDGGRWLTEGNLG